MGSGFSTCTIEEATKILNKSSRTIRLYIKEGLLHKDSDEKGHTILLRKEIDDLHIEKEQALPKFSKKILFGLLDRIRKLEEDMSVIRRALEIRGEPLRLNLEAASILFNEAKYSLSSRFNKWQEDEIKAWADLFDRFDASTLEAMPDKKRPWEVFYKLCIALMNYTALNVSCDSLLWPLLERGRKTLRDEAILWIEIGKGEFPKEAYFGLSTEKEAILSSLLTL